MTLRARNYRVTFARPFVLKGLEEVQPSGTYSIETREERNGLFSLKKLKQTSTWIRICRASGISGVLQNVNIDPADLADALIRDTEPEKWRGDKSDIGVDDGGAGRAGSGQVGSGRVGSGQIRSSLTCPNGNASHCGTREQTGGP